MAVAMARRVAAVTAATVLLDVGDMVVVAITLAQRRLGRLLGEDETFNRVEHAEHVEFLHDLHVLHG